LVVKTITDNNDKKIEDLDTKVAAEIIKIDSNKVELD